MLLLLESIDRQKHDAYIDMTIKEYKEQTERTIH